MFRPAWISARTALAQVTLGAIVGLGLFLVHAGLAAEDRPEVRAIELRDGSVLIGELLGMAEGRYRIRTPALGEIALPESEVLAIRSAAGSAPSHAIAAPGTPDAQGAMASIQRQLLGDPTLASAISALQDDPELQAALADPAFTRLILSGNLAALGTDPRFLRLMTNPAIAAILGQVSGQLGALPPGR